MISPIFFCLLAFSVHTYAADQIPIVDLDAIKTLPKLPLMTEWCEGECCGILKTKKALGGIQLFENPNTFSKKVATLAKGETFEEATFFTKISRFGEVQEEGKRLTVIVYQGEGVSLIWDGKEIRGSESNTTYKGSETESWVRIKTKAGVTGWANLPAKEGKQLDYGWCG